jgi:hypothetical protein
MKKILPIIIIGILVLSGLGASAIKDEKSKLEITSINFLNPILKDKSDFVEISMPKTNSFLMMEDKPILPSYKETYTYQVGTIIKSITCKLDDIQQKTISKLVIPTPEAVSASFTIKNQINHKNTIDYGEDLFPNEWFTYDVGRGRYYGEACVIVELQVFPIQYNPAEGIVEWANNFEIIIEYEEPKEPVIFHEDYDLVIIAPSEHSDELAPLITHKNNDMSISTIFISLSDIYGGIHFPVQGRDDQEKIKYFIKDAIENWGISSVLLVGSNATLPTRETHVLNGNDDEIFISDLYYADIYNETNDFCSWDSNENDVFGEFNWGPSHNYDEVDLYPDVYFGRLACQNGGEVTTSVNKIVTYETSEAYTKNWFNDIVVIGGDHAPGDDEAIPEGEFVNEKVMDVMAGFIPDKVWDSNGKLSKLLPTGVMEINSALNVGCGFVEFAGHGNTNVWATHPWEDENNWIPTPQGYYLSSQVKGLNNGDQLPIVIVGACSTFKFNKDPDCFGWSFILNQNGGGIAACGASGLDWFYLGEYVIEKGFEKICIDSFQAYKDGAMTFGEMWSGAINSYIYAGMDDLDHKTVEEFQSLGDPTLKIRADSQAPNKPTIPSGPLNGKTGTTYTYTTSATEPESEQIYYLFSWGDGSFSGWLGPYNSGDTGEADHKWSIDGSFEIKSIVKDENGVIGDWSDPLIVSMPRAKSINRPFLQFLLYHPNMFPILRQLFGL